MNGKKYHDCFLPFNPIIIITCGLQSKKEKHGLPYLSLKMLSALTLTIASILSNGGTCKWVFFPLIFFIFLFQVRWYEISRFSSCRETRKINPTRTLSVLQYASIIKFQALPCNNASEGLVHYTLPWCNHCSFVFCFV